MVLIAPNLKYCLACAFEFPSPYGDYGSYQLEGVIMENMKLKFPSPYGDYGSYHHGYSKRVSKETLAFPSPYGDYGSYLNHVYCMTGGRLQRFRPLTGIMVLIDINDSTDT